MQQSEMLKRLSRKSTALPSFYTYSYLNSEPLLCIFVDLNTDDDSESDEAGKTLEDDLVSHYGREHFNHFNQIERFISSREEATKIYESISAYWREKAKAFIIQQLQISLDEKRDYIFTFTPETI